MTATTKPDTTYNDWSNYETWAVNLWIGNEEPSHLYWQEAARECWNAAKADGTFSRDERANLNLADRLKSEIEDDAPDIGPSLYGDLLRAALSEVNWYEIATNLRSE